MRREKEKEGGIDGGEEGVRVKAILMCYGAGGDKRRYTIFVRGRGAKMF